MKQNITIEQLDKLSGKGRRELDEWAFEHDYIEWTNQCNDPECNCAFTTSPLLSIGQMVAFLDDANSGTQLFIEHWSPDYETDPYEWRVTFEKMDYGNDCYELCDALWEVVKEILETKKASS